MTQKDAAGLVSVKGRAWERPIEPNTGKPVENWRVPKEEIKTFLRDLCAAWDVRAVAYDPWSFAWTADELEAEGIPMIEVPQVPSRLAPATQGLYELIVDRLLRHDGDPTFARHIRNAVPKKVDRGYVLDKFHGRANDLAAALVTVTYELMQREEAQAETPAPAILFFDDESEVA
jgi:phage terminase large subunit-like protein